jgi:acetyl esterase/lipase
MRIRLTPDKGLRVEKVRLNGVPTLILRPADREPTKIGLMWIHGGGYITGMKEMVYMSRAADLVKKYGVTVVSPGYRLAWLHPWPAAVEDCFAALQFMDESRERLGIGSLMVGGESAGGGLTAAVCIMARDRGIRVAFQMPLYPMIDNHDTESSKDNHGKVWNTKRNHLGWRMYLRKERNDDVSPYAAAARQKDYSGLPPAYTFVGDGEPFYSETLKYIEDLNAAGVEASVDVYHTDTHAFDMLKDNWDISKEAVRKFNEHFEYALQNYKTVK